MKSYRLKDILYTARRNKKFTLEEVEERTLVSLGTLESLESGRYEYVPQMVYLKGQLKKISQLYGLHPEKIIELCTQEYERFQAKNPKKKSLNDRAAISPMILKNAPSIVIGTLIMIPIIGYLVFQVRSLLFVPRVVFDISEEFEITDDQDFTLRGVVSQGAKLTLNGQSVTIKSEGQFETNIQLNPGYNVLELKAKQRNQESTLLQKVVYVNDNGNQ